MGAARAEARSVMKEKIAASLKTLNLAKGRKASKKQYRAARRAAPKQAGIPFAPCAVVLLGGGQLRVLGAEARRRVLDKWSNARLADRHLEIYEELVARRHAA